MSGIKCEDCYIWGIYREQEGVLQDMSRSNGDWEDFLSRWYLNLAFEGENYIDESIYLTGESRANGIARSGKDTSEGTGRNILSCVENVGD